MVNKATMVASVDKLPTLIKAGTSISAQFTTSENAKCTIKSYNSTYISYVDLGGSNTGYHVGRLFNVTFKNAPPAINNQAYSGLAYVYINCTPKDTTNFKTSTFKVVFHPGGARVS